MSASRPYALASNAALVYAQSPPSVSSCALTLSIIEVLNPKPQTPALVDKPPKEHKVWRKAVGGDGGEGGLEEAGVGKERERERERERKRGKEKKGGKRKGRDRTRDQRERRRGGQR